MAHCPASPWSLCLRLKGCRGLPRHPQLPMSTWHPPLPQMGRAASGGGCDPASCVPGESQCSLSRSQVPSAGREEKRTGSPPWAAGGRARSELPSRAGLVGRGWGFEAGQGMAAWAAQSEGCAALKRVCRGHAGLLERFACGR